MATRGPSTASRCGWQLDRSWRSHPPSKGREVEPFGDEAGGPSACVPTAGLSRAHFDGRASVEEISLWERRRNSCQRDPSVCAGDGFCLPQVVRGGRDPVLLCGQEPADRGWNVSGYDPAEHQIAAILVLGEAVTEFRGLLVRVLTLFDGLVCRLLDGSSGSATGALYGAREGNG